MSDRRFRQQFLKDSVMKELGVTANIFISFDFAIKQTDVTFSVGNNASMKKLLPRRYVFLRLYQFC